MAFKIKLKAPRIKLKSPVRVRLPFEAGKFQFPVTVKAPQIKGPNFNPVLEAAGTVTGNVEGLIKKARGKIKKLPIVGTPASALFDWSYGYKIELISSIARGDRIDKAAYNALKVKVKSGQDLAPYAQTIISTVPGVGPGVSGAIGAANALSKGRPITEALYEGVKDSLPGGPVARAALEISYNLASGKSVGNAVINSIPVSDQEKRLIKQGVGAVADLAEGKKLNDVLVDRGIACFPDANCRKAAQIGIALAEGKRLQSIVEKEMPFALTKMGTEGDKIAGTNAFFKVGIKALGENTANGKGYLKGLGFMSHKQTEISFQAAMRIIPKSEKDGFGIALAAALGAARKGANPKDFDESFGKAIADGFGKKGSAKKKKKKVTAGSVKSSAAINLVAKKNPKIAKGVQEVENETWWDVIVDWFIG